MGSGFYVFCGVRWLDPDAQADALLIADGLARLETNFPHLRGATTLRHLEAVIRHKRSTWEQHLRTGKSNEAEESRGEAAVYPAAESFLAEDLSPPPRRRRALHHDGECLPGHTPAVATGCRPAASGVREPATWPAGADYPADRRWLPPTLPPTLPHPFCSDSLSPVPEPLLADIAAGPLHIICAWAGPARDPSHRPASLPGPGHPWAWYPAALPPTPRVPAAGASPPADWPSPSPPREWARGRGARRPRGA